MRKSVFSIGISIIVLLTIFFCSSVYYSNQIVYPEKRFDQSILQEWGVKGSDPKDYNLDYDEISFDTIDGLSLKGWYIKAQSNPSNRAIILVHGYGTRKIKMLKYAPFLNKSGFDVLLFDLRAHGESEGRICSMGYYEQRDVAAAVDFIYKKGIREIGIMGESLGAATSILAMANDQRIKAGVFDSSFSSARSQILYYGQTFRHCPKPLIDFAIFLTEKRFHCKLSSISPIDEVSEISPRPVFFIHGKKDKIVESNNAVFLYNKSKEPKSIWIASESGHAQTFLKYTKEYENKVTAFFNECF